MQLKLLHLHTGGFDFNQWNVNDLIVQGNPHVHFLSQCDIFMQNRIVRVREWKDVSLSYCDVRTL
jgi:hypothetical protein